MTTSTRAKTTTKSGKTRRAPRETKNPPIPGDDDDEEGSEAAGEEQHEGDGASKPPGPVMEQPPDPTATEDEAVTRSKDAGPNEASRDEPSPAILSAEQSGAGHARESHSTSTPAMDAKAVASVLQQLTAIVAGLQPQEVVAREDEGPTSGARNPEDQATRVPARVTPAAVAGSHEAPASMAAVASDSSIGGGPLAAPTRQTTVGGRQPRSGVVDAAPSPEMAAMATAVQQLTAMVSRPQPQSTSASAHPGGQQAGSRRTRAARTPVGALGGDGGGSSYSSSDGEHDSSSSSSSDAESESSDSEARSKWSAGAARTKTAATSAAKEEREGPGVAHVRALPEDVGVDVDRPG
ncbi:hypothetical protein PF006_g31254 [Phytophthora fragariae]|uniref:Uncharacterized protein n=3 Tax=Phytophthora fragariae TaxID=53985 RepID=A0A6A3GNG4_9STRA|nr:hypothetical protein PF003_g1834 [Phytophthora fragariae]KAE8958611.1 hypothetical protein PF011_g30706 [Phytophthora fragariae]KAE9062033.1 hypothetical protein PF006_g31254 [Phytophthora fragariae]